jgi:hypothetical protein
LADNRGIRTLRYDKIQRPTATSAWTRFPCCHALLQADYRTTYEQFSAKLQQTISKDAFVAPLSEDRVTTCKHGATGNPGNSVVSQLKLVHASQGSNIDVVTLVKDSNDDWKIDDIARLSPLAI